MLNPSLGVPAVGLLLAVATFAQISAGLMQARKGGHEYDQKSTRDLFFTDGDCQLCTYQSRHGQ
jgi:hypothetical protein